MIEAPDIPAQEAQLLVEARSLLPRLPFDEMDLLIVDQIGKELSGTGMDTNVIGRGVFGYISSLQPVGTLKPHISRIFVRDLSVATHGNGIGIGMADFTTTRAVKALNLNYIVYQRVDLARTCLREDSHVLRYGPRGDCEGD